MIMSAPVIRRFNLLENVMHPMGRRVKQEE